jgi:predicted ATPase/DNA-binding SARP family transcriptional activator
VSVAVPAAAFPPQLTSFVGREAEIAEIARLAGRTRLLTVTGPGGAGKTRLTAEALRPRAAAAPGEVLWVELAPLSDDGLVAQVVLESLGMREQPGQGVMGLFTQFFAARPALLVLDNAEHVLDGVARFAFDLLQASPDVRLVVTSRERLSVPGEAVWPIPPLSLPDGAGAEAMSRSDAVRLFVDRAVSVRPAFALDADTAPAVAEICRRLDGVPLALELAAARVSVLTPAQIAARLDDTLSLLTRGNRVALARQQTIRAAISWSYELLNEREKRVFRALSVFIGGFTLEAAERVCAGEGLGAAEVLDLLAGLADKSLVAVDEHDGLARYRLLEIVRQFGREQLARSPAEEAVRRRHAGWVAELAEAAEPYLFTGPSNAEDLRWVARMDRELGNVRAALDWCAEDPARVETELRINASLLWFWFARGLFSEGLTRIRAALGRADGGVPERLMARAVSAAGMLPMWHADYGAMQAPLEDALARWEALGERGPIVVQTLCGLTGTHCMPYLPPTPERTELARAYSARALALARAGDNHRALAFSLFFTGLAAELRGDVPAAVEAVTEGYELCCRLGHTTGQGYTLNVLGRLREHLRDPAASAAHYREALLLHHATREVWGLAQVIEGLGRVAVMEGRHERAARLFGCAGEFRRVINSPLVANEVAQHDEAIAAIRAALGDDATDRALLAGAAFSIDEAAAYVMADADAGAAPSPAPAPAAPPSGDPASAAAPSAEDDARLVVRTFGGLEVVADGRTVKAADWSYAKPRELFVFLLCGGACTRQQIGLALWPDASASQVRNQFHVTLHHLRKALGRAEWVVFEDDRYRFDMAGCAWDVDRFRRLVSDARAAAGTMPDRAAALLEEAVELVRGEFLDGETVGDWHLDVRDALRRESIQALDLLAGLRFDAGRYAEAAAAYRRILAADNLHAAAHRGVMRCHARMGEPALALRGFQVYSALLEDEVGAGPDAETVLVADRIRQGLEI